MNYDEHLKFNKNQNAIYMYSLSDNEQETMFTNKTSPNLVEPPLKECPSSINLEDICGDYSYNQHVWNERRVFRSSDGKLF